MAGVAEFGTTSGAEEQVYMVFTSGRMFRRLHIIDVLFR